MIGLERTTVLSASLAALALDRLVIGHFGSSAEVGSVLFAAATVVQRACGAVEEVDLQMHLRPADHDVGAPPDA